MSKFKHNHYDGKHWIKGTAEYDLDNELNRLNKQVMKFSKAKATNSPTYKQLVTEIAVLSHNQIKHVNGVPQAKRGAKEIAKAAALNGDKQFRKIAKSKSHKTFERYKTAAKKLGLTPNELSYISNESAVYYQTMYNYEDDTDPIEIHDDDQNINDYSPDIKVSTTYHNDVHNFDNTDKYSLEIFVEDIITPHSSGGYYNIETGELFNNYDDAIKSFDETVLKIQRGEWNYTHGHFNDNIDWDYYNQFKRKKEW